MLQSSAGIVISVLECLVFPLFNMLKWNCKENSLIHNPLDHNCCYMLFTFCIFFKVEISEALYGAYISQKLQSEAAQLFSQLNSVVAV